MASLKEIKGRINSIKNTRKITSAMKMVASVKLHRAQGAIENLLPYQRKMNSILTSFLSSTDSSFDSPYQARKEVKRVAIVVFSSNSSLCGAFNATIIKRFLNAVNSYKELGKENMYIYPVGKKVEEAAKKLCCEVKGSFQDMAKKPSYDDAAKLADTLMEQYANGEIDKIDLIFNHFKSSGMQELVYEPFLPVDLTQIGQKAKEDTENNEGKRRIDYIVEPSLQEFISNLLPTVLRLRIYTALLDSNASEHAARTMAMQVATDNANELIQDLTKQYNKSRQQAITNELLDIVGGSIKR